MNHVWPGRHHRRFALSCRSRQHRFVQHQVSHLPLHPKATGSKGSLRARQAALLIHVQTGNPCRPPFVSNSHTRGNIISPSSLASLGPHLVDAMMLTTTFWWQRYAYKYRIAHQQFATRAHFWWGHRRPPTGAGLSLPEIVGIAVSLSGIRHRIDCHNRILRGFLTEPSRPSFFGLYNTAIPFSIVVFSIQLMPYSPTWQILDRTIAVLRLRRG